MDLRLATDVQRPGNDRDDAGSVSTLEGGSGTGHLDVSATVQADVHAAAVLREAAGGESSVVADREWTEEWITVVEEKRGPGRSALTEQEVYFYLMFPTHHCLR